MNSPDDICVDCGHRRADHDGIGCTDTSLTGDPCLCRNCLDMPSDMTLADAAYARVVKSIAKGFATQFRESGPICTCGVPLVPLRDGVIVRCPKCSTMYPKAIIK